MMEEAPAQQESAEDEDARRQAEDDQRKAEIAQLSFGVEGKIAPSAARVQVTGGSVNVPAHELPKRDQQVRVTVLGWVKHDKTTTVEKGKNAVREMVIVTENIENVEVIGDAVANE